MSIHPRRRGIRSPLIAGAAAALAAMTVATAPQAQAVLSDVSPDVDVIHGFPNWYSDSDGTKLQLCVESDYCLGGSNLPDPEAPASLEENFPDEAFYSVVRAETTLNGGVGRIRWRAVLEAAFANGDVADGDQMTFTRVQVTGDKIPQQYIGQTLTFKTPYGDDLKAVVSRDGKVSRDRKESNAGDRTDRFTAPLAETQTQFGCTALPCRQDQSRFIRWDPAFRPAAPVDHLGNPAVLHRITGGIRNNFQVFDSTGAKSLSPSVTLFEVAGQLAD
jgi:hypothetical protein